MKFPKNRKQYELDLLFAFDLGMTCGYGIEHSDISNEERNAMKKFMREHDFKYSFEELREGG